LDNDGDKSLKNYYRKLKERFEQQKLIENQEDLNL